MRLCPATVQILSEIVSAHAYDGRPDISDQLERFAQFCPRNFDKFDVRRQAIRCLLNVRKYVDEETADKFRITAVQLCDDSPRTQYRKMIRDNAIVE